MMDRTTTLDRIKAYQQTAPVDVEGLIESFGIELAKKASLHPEIAGYIRHLGAGLYEIAVNGADHYYRRRFTMAHELGHFVLHRDLIGTGIGDNRAYRSTNMGTFYNLNIRPEHETEANRFAANLLMPAPLVRRVYSERRGNVAALSREFQVSFEAMSYRLKTLNLLPR